MKNCELLSTLYQERIRVRGVTPHIGLTLKVILLKLFLYMVPSSPADNVTAHVAWMFSWRMKMHVKSLELPT